MIEPMTPYELLDLMLSVSNRIDTHWAIFISVHLAIIGGIIYVDKPLSKREKAGAVIVYVGFAFINYYMMKGQANLLESIYTQIEQIHDLPCCQDNAVIAHMMKLQSFNTSYWLNQAILWIHAVMLLVIVLSISFDKKTNND